MCAPVSREYFPRHPRISSYKCFFSPLTCLKYHRTFDLSAYRWKKYPSMECSISGHASFYVSIVACASHPPYRLFFCRCVCAYKLVWRTTLFTFHWIVHHPCVNRRVHHRHGVVAINGNPYHLMQSLQSFGARRERESLRTLLSILVLSLGTSDVRPCKLGWFFFKDPWCPWDTWSWSSSSLSLQLARLVSMIETYTRAKSSMDIFTGHLEGVDLRARHLADECAMFHRSMGYIHAGFYCRRITIWCRICRVY